MVLDTHAANPRGRWWTGSQIAKKVLDGRDVSLDVNTYPVVAVENPSCKRMGSGEAKHVRAKPDTLNDAAYVNPARDSLFTSVCCHGTRHVRPRQPISLTRPSSTSTGTPA